MIDEKEIKGSIELFTMTEPFSPSENRLYEAGKTIVAAYREKCEECALWQKSEKECHEAYKKLSDKYEHLRLLGLGPYDYPTVIGGRA